MGSTCIYLVFIHFYLAQGERAEGWVLGKLTPTSRRPTPGQETQGEGDVLSGVYVCVCV